MSRALAFDQRAVALIELRGAGTDHELFEGALQDRGWPVLEKRGGEPSAVRDRLLWYTIEVRFPGSRINAVRGARERIEVVADEMQLDLQVQAVDLVVRDPDDRPRYFVYERPPVHPCTVPLPRWKRWTERARLWVAENTALRDTGRQVTATTALSAQWLAVRPLPGASLPRGGVAVRGGPARSSGFTVRPGRRESNGLLTRLLLLLVVGLWTGARVMDRRDHGAESWWWVVVVALAVALAAARAIRCAAPEASWGISLGLGVGGTVIAAGVGANLAYTAPHPGYGSRVVLVLIAAGVVFNGIRLLIRQWSWQRTAPWLLPALLPIVLGFLPSLGSGVHLFYLDAFGLDIGDVDAPQAYRLIAALKLAAWMCLWFVAPALLGYMKHCHWQVKDRWLGLTVTFILGLTLLLHGFWSLTLLPASVAGQKAVASAAQGRTPAGYYGIDPDWVCVQPIGGASGVPVDGGVLDPSRSYLKLGDAGGKVVLWDAAARDALKVPLSRLQIVPADSKPPSCAPR